MVMVIFTKHLLQLAWRQKAYPQNLGSCLRLLQYDDSISYPHQNRADTAQFGSICTICLCGICTICLLSHRRPFETNPALPRPDPPPTTVPSEALTCLSHRRPFQTDPAPPCPDPPAHRRLNAAAANTPGARMTRLLQCSPSH